jgi:hypothetical protein
MSDKVCCICNGPIDDHVTPEGKVYWTDGHNALPIKDGRCCTPCNASVISARIKEARRGESPSERIQIHSISKLRSNLIH